MWVELIALGLDPTCSLSSFLSLNVGPFQRKNGMMVGFTVVRRGVHHTHGLVAPGN